MKPRPYTTTFFPLLMLLVLTNTLPAQQTIDLKKVNDDIKKNAIKIGLSSSDINNYRISDAYIDKLSGATMVYLQQTYKGIDVFNTLQTVVFKNEALLSVAGSRKSNMESAVNVKNGVPAITAINAVRAAATHLKLVAPPFIVPLQSLHNQREVVFGDLGIATNQIKSKLIWLFKKTGLNAKLSWQVEIQPKGKPSYWLVNVDAVNGAVIDTINLTVSCNWGKFPDKSKRQEIGSAHTARPAIAINDFELEVLASVNGAKYRVVPYPAESPIHQGGTPSLQTNPWELAGAGNNATTLKWNDDGQQIYESTRGNNVLAQEDRDGNNGVGKSANSTTSQPHLTFDFIPDFTMEPTTETNQKFAITNLFYWNNILHDISYQYGFDEASGNFQANNLGRGGKGKDYVFADAQDGVGINDANFATPPDGTNPRMQMFLSTAASPQLDIDLDNGIISHEYMHGISNRLTGGPSNSACLLNIEARGLGEGWSDYMSLMATTNWNKAKVNDGAEARPMGTYVLNQGTNGRGTRRYPYSTDIATDPLTYAQLTTDPESHKIGEIWCTMLWEMTWNIIKEKGINTNLYDANDNGGNSIALKLVMEGMKLQPCNPGFIEARNAILKADSLLYDGQHSCAIWEAFTKRGLGYFASQGSSAALYDETADFISATVIKYANKTSVAKGEQIKYTLEVKASPCIGINNYTIIDTLPPDVTYVSGGSYDPAKRTVSFTGITLAPGATANLKFVVVNNGTFFPSKQFINEKVTSKTISNKWKNVEIIFGKWSVASVGGDHSQPYAFYALDNDVTSITALETANSFLLKGFSILSFRHLMYSDFDPFYQVGFDGGVVEISTDNGATWQDLGPYMMAGGYNTFIPVDSSYMKWRRAFSGLNFDFIETRINLTSFAGKNIKIRFLYTTDFIVGVSNGFLGWYVDDISLTSQAGVYNLASMFNNTNGPKVIADTITSIKNGPPTVTDIPLTTITENSATTQSLASHGSITVVPNPAKDKVVVTISGNNKPLRISLMNALGKQIRTYNMNGEYQQLKLPHLAAGVYYLKINGEGIAVTRKLIIQ